MKFFISLLLMISFYSFAEDDHHDHSHDHTNEESSKKDKKSLDAHVPVSYTHLRAHETREDLV